MRRGAGLGSLMIVMAAMAQSPALAQNAENGAQVFRKCRACHEIGAAAKNKVGPALTGIVGRKAGTVAGFNYSEAMSGAGAQGLVWTEDNLSAYLENPTGFMPKNKMSFAGIKAAADRADLIAYLKSAP